MHLGLLDHPTGVGLRYGFRRLCERWFSWKMKGTDFSGLLRTFGMTLNSTKSWRSLSRSYGCFIAEFLNASFPVRLGLLDHPTGVGLRYGFRKLCERWFSWRQKGTHSTLLRETFGFRARLEWRISLPLLASDALHVQSMRTLRFSYPVTPLLGWKYPFQQTYPHHSTLG